MNEIPIRASLFNLTVFVALFVALRFIQNDSSSKGLFLVLWIGILSFNLVKSPFIIFLTFRVDVSNARIDQEEDRERRRNLEIQDAIEKRNKRIARQLAIQEEGMLKIVFASGIAISHTITVLAIEVKFTLLKSFLYLQGILSVMISAYQKLASLRSSLLKNTKEEFLTSWRQTQPRKSLGHAKT